RRPYRRQPRPIERIPVGRAVGFRRTYHFDFSCVTFEAVSIASKRLSCSCMEISATIITLDEEMHLARCLESVRGIVDEIIVVDSGSQDRTREIAESYSVKFLIRPWTNYSDQKNFAAGEAIHEWILSLDADECLSSPLRDALLELRQKPVA